MRLHCDAKATVVPTRRDRHHHAPITVTGCDQGRARSSGPLAAITPTQRWHTLPQRLGNHGSSGIDRPALISPVSALPPARLQRAVRHEPATCTVQVTATDAQTRPRSMCHHRDGDNDDQPTIRYTCRRVEDGMWMALGMMPTPKWQRDTVTGQRPRAAVITTHADVAQAHELRSDFGPDEDDP